ncbi:MAG: TonB-dependent receptor [Azonexus sp.]
MKIEKTVIALAVSALLYQNSAVAEELERQLSPVTSSAAKDVEIQSRTELGRLNEYTPLAGSVVEREELETVRFVDSLNELLLRVPGVSMSRNMRFTDGGKNYTENRIDGMRARNTGTYSFLDQVNAGDIERVEFIRGPGSVLSGSNAIGGTINVITRNPPAKRELQATGEIFGDGGFRTGLTGGDQLNDSLGYFFNINRFDTDGWRDHSAEKKDSLSTKWVWRPDTSSKLAFRYEYIHDDFQSPGSLENESQFNSNWRQALPNTYYRTDVVYSTPSLHYRKLFGEVGELNIYGQMRSTDQTARSSGFTSSASTLGDTKSTETNFQLMYKHNFSLAKTSLTGGLDYLDTASRAKKYTDLSGSSFSFIRGALTGDSKSYEKNQSPFVQVEFSPLDPLRLTYGIRHDVIEYRIDDQLVNTKDGNAKYEKTVNKFGALYEFSPKAMLWVNVAEGFMGPGVSTLLGTGTPTPATPTAAWNGRYVPTNMALKPEESLTWEIGLRGQFDFGLKYDTGYYETEFTNLIVAQACIQGVDYCRTRNVNAAKAHASGVETSLAYDLNQYLEIGLAHTYAQYEYGDYVSATANYTGKQRYYTPRNHYNLRFTVKPAAGWRVELEVDRIDGYYTNQANTDTYERPDLINLRAGYRAKSWSAWLQALNLLDSKYAQRVGSTDAGVRNSYDAGYTPLMLRAGISYNF